MYIKRCEKLYRALGFINPNEEIDLFVHMSEGFTWNGWVEVYKDNELIYSSFKTNAMYSAVSHIINCNVCKELYKKDIEDYKRLKEEMDEEWKKVMS